MAKSKERMAAVKLRRQGKSVKEIARLLGVSSGSVSAWVRNITMTSLQADRLRDRWIKAGHRGRMLGAEANRQKKVLAMENAQTEARLKLRELTKKDLFFVGLGLYWGEGVKASNGITAVVNSDPRVIKLMKRWFEDCWGVTPDRFRARVFISKTHRDRELRIKRYWMRELGLPKDQFQKVIFLDKGKKIYENREVYYGVLTLRISKGSNLRHQILACISRVSDEGTTPV